MSRLFNIAIVICAVIGFTTADYRKDALNLHNHYRAEHDAPPLSLSNELNNYAQNWAQTMASSDSFKHSQLKYGENIYQSTDKKMTDSEAAIAATNMWYNEISNYDFDEGNWSKTTGHFTQVVWKNSKYFGISVARSAKYVYVCANYDPKGNVLTQFLQNVLD